MTDKARKPSQTQYFLKAFNDVEYVFNKIFPTITDPIKKLGVKSLIVQMVLESEGQRKIKGFDEKQLFEAFSDRINEVLGGEDFGKLSVRRSKGGEYDEVDKIYFFAKKAFTTFRDSVKRSYLETMGEDAEDLLDKVRFGAIVNPVDLTTFYRNIEADREYVTRGASAGAGGASGGASAGAGGASGGGGSAGAASAASLLEEFSPEIFNGRLSALEQAAPKVDEKRVAAILEAYRKAATKVKRLAEDRGFFKVDDAITRAIFDSKCANDTSGITFNKVIKKITDYSPENGVLVDILQSAIKKFSTEFIKSYHGKSTTDVSETRIAHIARKYPLEVQVVNQALDLEATPATPAVEGAGAASGDSSASNKIAEAAEKVRQLKVAERNREIEALESRAKEAKEARLAEMSKRLAEWRKYTEYRKERESLKGVAGNHRNQALESKVVKGLRVHANKRIAGRKLDGFAKTLADKKLTTKVLKKWHETTKAWKFNREQIHKFDERRTAAAVTSVFGGLRDAAVEAKQRRERLSIAARRLAVRLERTAFQQWREEAVEQRQAKERARESLQILENVANRISVAGAFGQWTGYTQRAELEDRARQQERLRREAGEFAKEMSRADGGQGGDGEARFLPPHSPSAVPVAAPPSAPQAPARPPVPVAAPQASVVAPPVPLHGGSTPPSAVAAPLAPPSAPQASGGPSVPVAEPRAAAVAQPVLSPEERQRQIAQLQQSFEAFEVVKGRIEARLDSSHSPSAGPVAAPAPRVPAGLAFPSVTTYAEAEANAAHLWSAIQPRPVPWASAAVEVDPSLETAKQRQLEDGEAARLRALRRQMAGREAEGAFAALPPLPQVTVGLAAPGQAPQAAVVFEPAHHWGPGRPQAAATLRGGSTVLQGLSPARPAVPGQAPQAAVVGGSTHHWRSGRPQVAPAPWPDSAALQGGSGSDYSYLGQEEGEGSEVYESSLHSEGSLPALKEITRPAARGLRRPFVDATPQATSIWDSEEVVPQALPSAHFQGGRAISSGMEKAAQTLARSTVALQLIERRVEQIEAARASREGLRGAGGRGPGAGLPQGLSLGLSASVLRRAMPSADRRPSRQPSGSVSPLGAVRAVVLGRGGHGVDASGSDGSDRSSIHSDSSGRE